MLISTPISGRLVEMPAEVGIARILGMKEVPLKDHRDLAKKAELFNRELAEGTLVYAHIKGPDEFGHDEILSNQ